MLAVRTDRLLETLEHARFAHSLDAEVRRPLGVELLVLDDVGLDAMDATESRDISELFLERHRVGSIVVTSNRGPDADDPPPSGNAGAEQLAEASSRLTGETKTEAVTRALRDRLTRLRRERSGRSLADELDEIARHCAGLPVLSTALPSDARVPPRTPGARPEPRARRPGDLRLLPPADTPRSRGCRLGRWPAGRRA